MAAKVGDQVTAPVCLQVQRPPYWSYFQRWLDAGAELSLGNFIMLVLYLMIMSLPPRS